MSILKNMTKLSAALAMAASFATVPAVAQTSTSVAAAVTVSTAAGQFRGRRGVSRRGFSRGRGFSSRRSFNRGFSRRNSFRGSGFNRGFRGNSFNRGFRGNSFKGGFKGSSFNRGFRGSSFNRGFRGSNFNRGFNRGFRGNSFGRSAVVVKAPLYSVGGFYGFTGNTVIISDFGAHGLYAPPRGYQWVCDKGSKDAILSAVATGAIIAVAANILATPY